MTKKTRNASGTPGGRQNSNKWFSETLQEHIGGRTEWASCEVYVKTSDREMAKARITGFLYGSQPQIQELGNALIKALQEKLNHWSIHVDVLDIKVSERDSSVAAFMKLGYKLGERIDKWLKGGDDLGAPVSETIISCADLLAMTGKINVVPKFKENPVNAPEYAEADKRWQKPEQKVLNPPGHPLNETLSALSAHLDSHKSCTLETCAHIRDLIIIAGEQIRYEKNK